MIGLYGIRVAVVLAYAEDFTIISRKELKIKTDIDQQKRESLLSSILNDSS
jgi:hypothetical protein